MESYQSQLPAKPERSPQNRHSVPKRVLEQDAAREPMSCPQGNFGLPRGMGDSPPAKLEEQHIGPFHGWMSCHSCGFQRRLKKKKTQKTRELFLLTSSLLDLTASSSHVLLQRSGAPNTETWIPAKDLVCYNYTEHRSIQNLHSKTLTKKLSKISDPHLHQN